MCVHGGVMLPKYNDNGIWFSILLKMYLDLLWRLHTTNLRTGINTLAGSAPWSSDGLSFAGRQCRCPAHRKLGHSPTR